MALSNAGRNHIATGLIGGSVTVFNAANSYIGVGNSSTAFDATQTDLQGTNVRQAMDSTYPMVVSGNIWIFQSTFATGSANFAWNEWGVFNAASVGTMLNRKVETLGTKTSTQAWTIQASITLNNP